MTQLCMVAAVSLRTVANEISAGRPLPLVAPALRAEVGKLNAAAGPLAIGAAMLSKTSFALTLLRVVLGRLRWALWGIIAAMNIALLLSILMLLASCKPIAKGWDPTLAGECWPQYVTVRFGLFASGEQAFPPLVRTRAVEIWNSCVLTGESVFRCFGFCAGGHCMVGYLGRPNADAREDRRRGRNEHGRLVSLTAS